MRIYGNTILITGGAGGIGLALAEAFLHAENQVIVCGRHVGKLEAAASSLPGLHTLRCDLRDARQCEAMCRELALRFPGLNVLIHNAGIQQQLDFASGRFDADAIADELDTNLGAPIHLTHRLLPLLRAQPESVVAFVSSALARVPKASAPVYCASKAGLQNFARALRYQLEGTATRVIDIVPDLVDTAMTRQQGGARKMTPRQVAGEVLAGLARGNDEVLTGRTRLLFRLHRLLPSVAYGLLKRG